MVLEQNKHIHENISLLQTKNSEHARINTSKTKTYKQNMNKQSQHTKHKLMQTKSCNPDHAIQIMQATCHANKIMKAK